MLVSALSGAVTILGTVGILSTPLAGVLQGVLSVVLGVAMAAAGAAAHKALVRHAVRRALAALYLYGIDVSGFQTGIDLSVVACDFVGIYLTGGCYSTNPDACRQLAQAIANGKRIILYHFENDGSAGTPQQEAAWFLSQVAALGPLPPNTLYALDNETANALNVPWQQAWLDIVRAARGRGTGMYAPFTNLNTGVYQPLRDAGYFIWESAYILGAQQINGYTLPAGRAPIPGGDPAIWQFTPSLVLVGWNGLLDGDVFLGGPADWDALAGVSPYTADEQFFVDLNIPLP